MLHLRRSEEENKHSKHYVWSKNGGQVTWPIIPGPLLVGGIMAGGAEAWGAAGGGACWAGAGCVWRGREGWLCAGTEGRETPVRLDTGINTCKAQT